jgi:DNA-binding response OmpR family regulator
VNDKANVLLAEDEILIAIEIQDTLEEFGYDVCGIAATASEAVRMADRHKPRLALVDVNLAQGSNGLDAVREMKARWETPCIIVSGHANETDARSAGAIGFVAKPFHATDLLELMSYALAFVAGNPAAGPAPKGFIAG